MAATMPLPKYHQIYLVLKEQLLEGHFVDGLPGETPVAIVQDASLPTQRHVLSTLGRMHEALSGAGIGSPAIIVVGDVLQGVAAAGLQAERFGT